MLVRRLIATDRECNYPGIASDTLHTVRTRGGSGLKIAELASASDLPVATIKFYLREGLLPSGERTAANQAVYSDAHLRRLQLIRILIEVGGLSLQQVKAVSHAIDDHDLATHMMLTVAQHALGPAVADDPAPDAVAAREEVDRFVDDDLGWQVSAGAPSRRALARALVTLRRTGRDVDASVFRPYARAADWLASDEVEAIQRRGTDRGDVVEQTVVGTVVFESAVIALRRLAQEHRSARSDLPAPRGEL
jgi:DNA-binding transcriptional MerR regulator